MNQIYFVVRADNSLTSPYVELYTGNSCRLTDDESKAEKFDDRGNAVRASIACGPRAVVVDMVKETEL